MNFNKDSSSAFDIRKEQINEYRTKGLDNQVSDNIITYNSNDDSAILMEAAQAARTLPSEEMWKNLVDMLSDFNADNKSESISIFICEISNEILELAMQSPPFLFHVMRGLNDSAQNLTDPFKVFNNLGLLTKLADLLACEAEIRTKLNIIQIFKYCAENYEDLRKEEDIEVNAFFDLIIKEILIMLENNNSNSYLITQLLETEDSLIRIFPLAEDTIIYAYNVFKSKVEFDQNSLDYANQALECILHLLEKYPAVYAKLVTEDRTLDGLFQIFTTENYVLIKYTMLILLPMIKNQDFSQVVLPKIDPAALINLVLRAPPYLITYIVEFIQEVCCMSLDLCTIFIANDIFKIERIQDIASVQIYFLKIISYILTNNDQNNSLLVCNNMQIILRIISNSLINDDPNILISALDSLDILLTSINMSLDIDESTISEIKENIQDVLMNENIKVSKKAQYIIDTYKDMFDSTP